VLRPSPARIARALKARLPASRAGWVLLVASALALATLLGTMAYVLWPLAGHPHGYGRHDWDLMESRRYLVVKSLLRFHELPFWNPYACGGHPEWGSPDGAPELVAPWLPAYLALSLPVATRVEIFASIAWSALGAWLLASRFTRSAAARALVVVLFAVNGRFTLQLVAGHGWHLVYAWTPWALFFFDRALGPRGAPGPVRPRYAAWTGACLAMMLYTAGITPLAQTCVLLAVYAVLVAIGSRSARPAGMLVLAGVVAAGLSAPKLLPVVDVVRRFPRAVPSTDTLNPTEIVAMLTNREQGFAIGHGGIPDGSWHEVGMYVGWPALLLLAAGVLGGKGGRVLPLKVAGVVLALLGLGSFTKWSPWTLAHDLPVLSWEHVPYTWLVPALLLLACAAAAGFERALRLAGRRRPTLELASVLVVAWIARDVGTVARYPLENHLMDAGPSNAESTGSFHTELKIPRPLEYEPGEWAPTTLSVELANLGTIECNTFPGLSNFGSQEWPSAVAAHATGDTAYRGEVYLDAGGGAASFISWSPDAFDVKVDRASPGATVVVNQNWDPGWRADGAEAMNFAGTIGARVTQPTQVLRFRYRPRGWWAGVTLLVLTLAAIVGLIVRGRAAARRLGGPAPRA
jgi:hypothetical protein